MYIKPIVTAFLTFPFIAFLIAIPYLIYQYRKYGSLPFIRSLIFYSFVLYLMCSYFLVILPLPSMEYVKNLTTPRMQLVLFRFVRDFINNTHFVWYDFSTYLPTIFSPVFYQVLFNLLLLIPFGIYLRYYYKCDLKKVVIFTFLLSLFFEITQLTGLFFIYPRSYRIFDVDDLLINTLGGIIGYFVSPLVERFLPSRKKVDEMSFERGEIVSTPRRLVAFVLDSILFVLLMIFLVIFTSCSYSFAFIFVFIFYFIFLGLVLDCSTLGERIVKIKIVSKEGEKSNILYMIRVLIFGIFFLPLPYYLVRLINWINFGDDLIIDFSIICALIVGVSVIIVKIFGDYLLYHEFFYERVSRTKFKSYVRSD